MSNPLLSDWTTPHQTPPFDQIEIAHFKPAFDVALKQHCVEIAAIVQNAAAPSFDNTILALKWSGKEVERVSMVFNQLTSAATDAQLQAV